MKATDAFTSVILEYLTTNSKTDIAIKLAMENPDKNMDDCVTYILNTVKKSGLVGFSDQEVYDMAIEYYTTEKLEIGSKHIKSQVVINRIPTPTAEEKEKARQKAFEELVSEEKKNLSKRMKSKANSISSPSLFD